MSVALLQIVKPKAPKPQTQKPKTKGPWTDTKISWATTQPHPTIPPITFMHEGGVPQKHSKSKKGSEWSPLLVQQKNSGGKQEEGHGVREAFKKKDPKS